MKADIGAKDCVEIDIREGGHVYFAEKDAETGEYKNGEDYYAEWDTLDAESRAAFTNVRNSIAACKAAAIEDIRELLERQRVGVTLKPGLRAVIHTDGSSLGNPGPAGVGVVIEIEGCDAIECHANIGHTTNSVAEYKALIRGVKKALKLGASDLDIYLDSQFVVKQVKGKYKVKSPAMVSLHAEATTLLARAARYKLTYIPREQNTRADALAGQGALFPTPAEPCQSVSISAAQTAPLQ